MTQLANNLVEAGLKESEGWRKAEAQMQATQETKVSRLAEDQVQYRIA